MSTSIKKGDRVLVIAGNDRGRSGTVLRRMEDRVVVQGMNIRKKHVKRRSEVQTPSIIEMEMPIHISNVCRCDDEGKKLKKGVQKQEAPKKTAKKKTTRKKVENV